VGLEGRTFDIQVSSQQLDVKVANILTNEGKNNEALVQSEQEIFIYRMNEGKFQ
jgi:hypothetical protein